jgi:hypothetical protein
VVRWRTMSHCGAWETTKDCGEREVEDRDILVILKKKMGGKKCEWVADRGKELQPHDIEGIRQFIMVNRGREEITMTL